MRFRRFVLLIIMALLIAIFASSSFDGSAQENQPQRPGLDVLLWGESLFPFPEWYFTLDEHSNGAFGSWLNYDISAVVSYTKRIDTISYDMDMLLELINDDWIAGTLANYSDWELVERCVVNNHIVAEIDIVFEGSPYHARYWAWPHEETGFYEVFATYQDEDGIWLDGFTKAKFPDSPVCPSPRND